MLLLTGKKKGMSWTWPWGPSGLVATAFLNELTQQVSLSCCLLSKLYRSLLSRQSSREHWKPNQRASSWQNFRVRYVLSCITLPFSLEFNICEGRINVLCNLAILPFLLSLRLCSVEISKKFLKLLLSFSLLSLSL